MSNQIAECPHISEDAGPKSSTAQDTDHLIPLKTKLELSAQESVVNVYIAAVFPPQKSSAALSLAGKLVPNDGGLNLQHLSRFAKYVELPETVRTSIASSQLAGSPLLDKEAKYFIVGSTNAISEHDLRGAFSVVLDTFLLFTIPVPGVAPTSQEQASLWTKKYWRTSYNKNHSSGPHPYLLAKAAEEISGDTGRWMRLAAEVAREAKTSGCGEEIGVVVTERLDGVARPIAIAGDARWLEWPRVGSGNVTAHAALRVIGMVTEGLRLKDELEESMQQTAEQGIFQDQPLGALEKGNYHPSESKHGYLCHNLEIYCTHEPCVMCSMAIVHSRFGKVIFGQRMSRTGGFCADGDLGHGLFWRKELNWSLYAWHWGTAVSDAHGTFDGDA